MVARMYSTVRSNSFWRVDQALADLPHDQVHHLAPARDHLLRKLLHAGDPLGHRHGRPAATAVIVGRDGGLEGLPALRLADLGVAADLHGRQRAIALVHMHRGKDGLAVSLPGLELAIDEVGALVDGIELAILGRDIALPRKELLQVVGRDHCCYPVWGDGAQANGIRHSRANSSREVSKNSRAECQQRLSRDRSGFRRCHTLRSKAALCIHLLCRWPSG